VQQTGGTVTSSGTMEATGGGVLNVNNLVSPHNGMLTARAGSTITINGSLTQSAAATMNVDIGGTSGGQFGRIAITGVANLAGALNATFVNGFTPTVGNSFQVMTYSSQAGTFDTVNAVNLANGQRLNPVYGASALSLTVVAGAAVSALVLPGDFNGDDRVDTADYVVYRKTLGQHLSPFTVADGNGSGIVDSGDYDIWKANFGKAKSAPAAGSSITFAAAAAEEAAIRSGEKWTSSAAFDLALADWAASSRGGRFVPAKRPVLTQSVLSVESAASVERLLASLLGLSGSQSDSGLDMVDVGSTAPGIDSVFAEFDEQESDRERASV
jgi:hypothetical protein